MADNLENEDSFKSFITQFESLEVCPNCNDILSEANLLHKDHKRCEKNFVPYFRQERKLFYRRWEMGQKEVVVWGSSFSPNEYVFTYANYADEMRKQRLGNLVFSKLKRFYIFFFFQLYTYLAKFCLIFCTTQQ